MAGKWSPARRNDEGWRAAAGGYEVYIDIYGTGTFCWVFVVPHRNVCEEGHSRVLV